MSANGLHRALDHLRRLSAPPDCRERSDGQLLADYVADRDEAAFAALVWRHGPMVFGVARRLLRDRHAAEDVFQATFLVLAATARTIRQRESVSSWLYGVAQRLAARVRLTGRRWQTDARHGVAMPPPRPEADLTQRELETALDEELKELPDRHRAPLVLCYLEGQTQDEAARRLGWSKATLRRRLERGRALLRARLLRRGVSLSLGLLTTALAAHAEAGALPPALQKAALASLQEAAHSGAGAVSPAVAGLAEWGAKTMPATRTLLAAWLLVSVLAAGGGLAAGALARPGPPPAGAGPVPAAGAADKPAAEKRAALGAVWGVAYSPDGRTLATGSGEATNPGTLVLWDVPAGKVRLRLGQPRGVRCVAFSPDGKQVAAAGWDNVVRLFDVRTGKVQATLRGHTAAVNALAFAPDGKVLASCSLDQSVCLWDPEKGAELRRLRGHKDWVLSVAFFPDGKTLASAGKDGAVRVWDAASGTEKRGWASPSPLESVAVSPDGKLLAAGGWDCQVRLWDAQTGAPRAVLRGHQRGVLSLSFSPDGRTLASVSGNFNKVLPGEVKLWRVATGEELATLPGHPNSAWSVRFAPDGRSLATAGRDQTVRLWEVATGRERRALDNPLDTADARPPAALTDKERDELWKALAGPDAARAQRALARLVAAPGPAVPWLGERLKPGRKPDAALEKRLRELIAQLDDDEFARREKATEELEKLGGAAGPALRGPGQGPLGGDAAAPRTAAGPARQARGRPGKAAHPPRRRGPGVDQHAGVPPRPATTGRGGARRARHAGGRRVLPPAGEATLTLLPPGAWRSALSNVLVAHFGQVRDDHVTAWGACGHPQYEVLQELGRGSMRWPTWRATACRAGAGHRFAPREGSRVTPVDLPKGGLDCAGYCTYN